MSKPYKHLSQDEREQLAQMYWEQKSLKEIAGALRRAKSTISRELKRNSAPTYNRYTPCRAQVRSSERKSQANSHQRLKNDQIQQYMREKLAQDWSPELIAGRLKMELPGCSISHEAIYQYIYHPRTPNRLEMISHLRHAHRKRKAKGLNRKEQKTKIPNRIPIEGRPKTVEHRRQFGHWEGDSLVSRKSQAALNSLTERKSRLLLLTRLDRKGAAETNQAIIRRLKGFSESSRRTLTLDNGSENTQHEKLTARLGIRCFFAHPYSSWERGTNEHINGLIRWYLPKGTDFAKITKEQITQIEYRINNRPRKCLGFKTPLEIAYSCVALRC
jgi:transposase, IS30 family